MDTTLFKPFNKQYRCQHGSNKLWSPIKTLRVTRDGWGNAKKVILERCNRCGDSREREVKYVDMRVERPYINSNGPIFSNAIRKNYKKDEQEHYNIFN